MTEQYPYGVCKLKVNDNDDSVQCDLCDIWNYINCVKINKQEYENLKKYPLPWHRPACMSESPFPQMNNKEFKTYFIQQTLSNNTLKSLRNQIKK